MEQRNNLVLHGTETFSRGALDNVALESGAVVLDGLTIFLNSDLIIGDVLAQAQIIIDLAALDLVSISGISLIRILADVVILVGPNRSGTAKIILGVTVLLLQVAVIQLLAQLDGLLGIVVALILISKSLGIRRDRKSTRLNSSHKRLSRMQSSA